jgi:hypothetical protein
MTVAATSKTLGFEIGKGTEYRRVELNLTHSSSTSTIYTAEMFNTAPPARTLPTGINRVSAIRFFTVSKGAGATVTGATIALSFEENDTVSQASTLRIAKDDGAGNWVNIGNTFVSGVPSGFIVSGSFTTFSDFVLANATGGTNGLPVEWLSFTADAVSPDANLLQWSTATEENNKGFEVERSWDGKNYSTISFIKGHENTQTVSRYVYADKDPELAQYPAAYYRLRQIDFNGDFEYSAVRIVKRNADADGIQVYPNPAGSTIQLYSTELTGKAQLVLTNMTGQSYVLPETMLGQNAVIDISHVRKGLYTLRVITSEQSYSIKLVIQ